MSSVEGVTQNFKVMARTKKTTNKNEVTEVNNLAQVLPAPAVDDATTTKGDKTKPVAHDDSDTNSKTAVFAALRAWLKIDSDTAKANSRAGELIAAGVAPLDAVKQATKECRGRGSESCTVTEFLDELRNYPNFGDLWPFLISAGINTGDACDGIDELINSGSGNVVTHHAPGDDDSDDDSEGGYNTATATATVLGVTFSETYRYKVRPATWLACFQALKSCDMPRAMAAKAARRGRELKKQAQALNEICSKLQSMGADPAKIRDYIPAGILNAE